MIDAFLLLFPTLFSVGHELYSVKVLREKLIRSFTHLHCHFGTVTEWYQEKEALALTLNFFY